MKNSIKEFIEPTDREKNSLWENAVFVFDTNILLNLYRYSSNTRKSLLDAFESFKDRIWLPYQVAYEYMNRRCEVIYETINRYDRFKEETEKYIKFATDILRLNKDDNDIADLTKYLYKWININQNENLLVINPNDDEILNRLLNIFEGRVGTKPEDSEVKEIVNEGEERYKKQIPPGYMDSKKMQDSNTENNAFGDLIVWKQIIKYAKDNKVGIIFVTHDQKDDWWNIKSGKTIGPRIELRREFVSETNQLFHMYNMKTFISIYNKLHERQINDSVIIEINNLDQNIDERHKIKYSVSEKIAQIEEAIEKIKIRLSRQQRIISDYEADNEQNIETGKWTEKQYENAKQKIKKLENELRDKQKELELMQNQ